MKHHTQILLQQNLLISHYDIILYQFNEVNDFVNKPHPEYPDYSFNLDSLFKKSKVK